jgi:hypothetical protein
MAFELATTYKELNLYNAPLVENIIKLTIEIVESWEASFHSLKCQVSITYQRWDTVYTFLLCDHLT